VDSARNDEESSTDGGDAEEGDQAAPGTITDLSATAGDGKVTLAWKNPSDSDLAHVRIAWNSDDGPEPPITANPGDESATVSGLTNGTEYTFTVKAVVNAGNASAGTTVSATPAAPDESAPAEVTNLSATPGDGKVALSWTDPSDSDLDHIEITWSPTDGNTQPKIVSAGTESATVTGLTNGNEYTATVKTVDGAGNTSAGITINLTPDGTPPAEVSSLSATRGDTQVSLSWTDPSDSDLDHIEITWSPTDGESQPKTLSAGIGNATVTGLTNGTVYTFTVKKVDEAGNTSAGVTADAKPDGTAPSEVSSLSATAGDTEISLSWDDPSESDLDHIKITWSPEDGESQPKTVSAGTESATLTGLNNGTEYTFIVKTIDGAGNTSAGITTNATADGTPPGEVSNISETTTGFGENISLEITWEIRRIVILNTSRSAGVTIPETTQLAARRWMRVPVR
jgi:chitodextrinase